MTKNVCANSFLWFRWIKIFIPDFIRSFFILLNRYTHESIRIFIISIFNRIENCYVVGMSLVWKCIFIIYALFWYSISLNWTPIVGGTRKGHHKYFIVSECLVFDRKIRIYKILRHLESLEVSLYLFFYGKLRSQGEKLLDLVITKPTPWLEVNIIN